jgi:hypothetical protein
MGDGQSRAKSGEEGDRKACKPNKALLMARDPGGSHAAS